MRKLGFSAIALAAMALLSSCSSDADVASHNISKAADNFEVNRRITVINGITNDYLLVIEGRCSLGNNDPITQRTVTCKDGPNSYKKHTIGLSDNTFYMSEQLDPINVSVYNYKVVFKPESILPDVDLHTSGNTK